MAKRKKPKDRGLEASPAFRRPPPTKVIRGPERLPSKKARSPGKPAPSPLAATIAAVRAKNPAPVTEFTARADDTWKPPEILRGSLTGRKTAAALEPIVPVVTEPGPPKATLHEMRTRGATLSGLFGAAASIVALLMLVLHGIVPWVTAHPDNAVGPSPARLLPEGTLTRDGLEPMTGASLYAARLIDWPLAGLIWALIFGAALFGVDELPRMRADRHRLLQTALLAALAFAGFLLLLDAFRWIGLYAASLMDDGASPLHLHLFPYLVLLLGAVLLLGSGILLARKVRHLLVTRADSEALDDLRPPLWIALAATLGLLLLPLLPLAALNTGSGGAYVNEGELDAARSPDAFGLAEAANDYATARGLLWLIFYLAWAAFVLAVAERVSPHRALHPAYLAAHAAIGLPLGIAVLFALFLQLDLRSAPMDAGSLPLLLPMTLLALSILYASFVRRRLLPYLQRAAASLPD